MSASFLDCLDRWLLQSWLKNKLFAQGFTTAMSYIEISTSKLYCCDHGLIDRYVVLVSLITEDLVVLSKYPIVLIDYWRSVCTVEISYRSDRLLKICLYCRNILPSLLPRLWFICSTEFIWTNFEIGLCILVKSIVWKSLNIWPGKLVL